MIWFLGLTFLEYLVGMLGVLWLTRQHTKERELLRTELFSAIGRHDIVAVRDSSKDTSEIPQVHYVDDDVMTRLNGYKDTDEVENNA